METLNEDYKNIPGWGMDADPRNEPTYPMKNYTGDDHNRINYERWPQQPHYVEILHSNERPGLSAVFGTTVPPSGLSGMIRRYAFKHSEDRYRHWLPLLFADRVNVVEGVLSDFAHGHVPNMVKEHGWAMEWRYNRKAFTTKMAVTGLAMAALGLILYKKAKH